MRKKTEREKKAVNAAIHQLEARGYSCFLCLTQSDVFDILAEWPFSDDRGILFRVEVDSIRPDVVESVRSCPTKHHKGIILRKFGTSKNDPGVLLCYFFEKEKLVHEPKQLPLEKAMSSPRKVRATIPKKRAKSRNTGA